MVSDFSSFFLSAPQQDFKDGNLSSSPMREQSFEEEDNACRIFGGNQRGLGPGGNARVFAFPPFHPMAASRQVAVPPPPGCSEDGGRDSNPLLPGENALGPPPLLELPKLGDLEILEENEREFLFIPDEVYEQMTKPFKANSEVELQATLRRNSWHIGAKTFVAGHWHPSMEMKVNHTVWIPISIQIPNLASELWNQARTFRGEVISIDPFTRSLDRMGYTWMCIEVPLYFSWGISYGLRLFMKI
ncbi:hypothetical protein EJ110_NYTH49310 [Nymphaea thermarum]|nr:hypothetical protein EJ110_NYTH49310 [Nymphaea thermarum]